MKIAILVVFAFALLARLSFAQPTGCDYKVGILLDSYEFTKENFTWKMRATNVEGGPTNVTGTARIEQDNNIIKSYKPWTNLSISKQKTSNAYSPNLNEGEYKITAEIFVECDDSDKANNADAKNFRIIGKSIKLDFNENMASQTAQQTNTEQLQLNEAKNDAVINETVNEENTKNETYSNETNDYAQKIQTQNTAVVDDKEFNNVINLKDNLEKANIESDIVYKSSNERAKELVIYSILGLSVLLNIILIWKRN